MIIAQHIHCKIEPKKIIIRIKIAHAAAGAFAQMIIKAAIGNFFIAES